ncbi:MAG: transcriptional regulator GcvA [Pontibacterium sp.]
MSARKLPPLNALRSFESAARLGSFNQAAEELFVTPSAVSHQIKTLESYLNCTLFRREKRRVFLTAPGERYLVSVQHALDEIDSATRRLLSSQNAGSVNISVVPAFLTRWLVPRLADFQRQYPDVELRLTSLMGDADFEHSDIEMAIYLGSGGWRNTHEHFLRKAEVIPVCSPLIMHGDHPLHNPSDVRHHTLIHVASRRNEWPQFFESAGIPWSNEQKSLTFSSTALALSAAMEGLGIALSDRQLVTREVELGHLCRPFDLSLDIGRAFYLVYSNKRQPTYEMSVFRDWLIGNFSPDEEPL